MAICSAQRIVWSIGAVTVVEVYVAEIDRYCIVSVLDRFALPSELVVKVEMEVLLVEDSVFAEVFRRLGEAAIDFVAVSALFGHGYVLVLVQGYQYVC